MSRRSKWNDYRHWEYYPKSRPRAVEGGIKAQTTAGGFGKSWWAKRWISVLEGFNIGARLARGRSYARKGQVVSIEIDQGRVKAQVQGSRPRPYDVSIAVKTILTAEWDKLLVVLSGQALFAAKLLAGEMPQEIEEVFKGVDLSLFPRKLGDLSTACSCPDSSNPCKHIAAVYYLLGEEFDRDPFLMFRLRGMTREELLERLGRATASTSSRRVPDDQPAEASLVALPDPLSAEPETFWNGSLKEGWLGAVAIPPVAAALPKRLGSFPFWRGTEPFLKAVEPIYKAAAQRGLDTVLGPAPGAAAEALETTSSGR
jgi:uncharacterized Zn finger protein